MKALSILALLTTFETFAINNNKITCTIETSDNIYIETGLILDEVLRNLYESCLPHDIQCQVADPFCIYHD